MPVVAATTLVAVVVFLLLGVLGVGAGSRTATSSSDPPAPVAIYEERTPHVLSSVIVTGLQGGVKNAAETPPSQLPPLPASAFKGPVTEYLAYAVVQVGRAEREIPVLERALAAGDRAEAEEAWRVSYADYLRLGGTYLTGQLARLNREIDGNAGGLSGGVDSPEFTGLHRIEYGLWTQAATQTLEPFATQLGTDLAQLKKVLPTVTIEPLEYATRTHEILEDAVRDLLSGVDVPWSGEGVLATAAGLEATEELVATLHTVLKGREGVIPLLEVQLPALASTLHSLAAEHGGHLPSNGELTQQQSETLDAAIGAALEALAQVPGALETELPPHAPKIPANDLELDP
jgi:high-affinity iron transporter